MINILSVFIGGGLGSLLRYVINISFEKHSNLPLPVASLCVNIVSSLILGLLFGYFLHRAHIPDNLKVALTVGFCGGLSTFSAFSLEVFKLFENGQMLTALLYILLSVVVCTVMVALGIFVGLKV